MHEAIEKFLEPFKKLPTPIRWVKTKNIHLTLKFLGEITQNHYPQLETHLDTTNYTEGNIDIRLTGCGTFGRKGTPNIFWLGISKNSRLEQLFHSIENTLHPIGYDKETRPFKPHITVGRNKKNHNFKPLFNLIEEHNHLPITQFTATHFQVFKSDLKPAGPIYTILKEIPLTHAKT
ncbi:MAG: RNA 2',3'-cyclic phosphodiesterase [bacterium]|nr:RNA 2',3'-cyclic phosphodiesterase [bacterium]